MPSGGCFCDKIRYSFTGEPAALLLCHCLDCRKISGSAFSNNVLVPDKNFKLESGSPKTIAKVADSGKNITSHFCGDCGSTLFRTGENFDGNHIVKAGTLDDKDWPNQNVPKGELFPDTRVAWVSQIEGAQQMK